MAETVDCAECGNRYDSQVNPFCPRCGSTKTGVPVPGAVPVSQRADPRRRRLQAAGVVLGVMGLLSAASLAYIMAFPPSASPAAYEAYANLAGGGPGGQLHVRVLVEGRAAGNETLAIGNETSANQTVRTDSHGWSNLTLPHAVTQVVVVAHNATKFRFYVPANQTYETTINATSAQGVEWQGAPLFSPGVIRAVAGAFLAMSLLVFWGGLCAVRQRDFIVAVVGAAMAIPVSFLLGELNILISALYVAMAIWALVVIVRRRAFFLKRGSPPPK